MKKRYIRHEIGRAHALPLSWVPARAARRNMEKKCQILD